MRAGDPPGSPSPALRVIVTDVAGRPVRDPGVGRWLRAVAPASARGVMGLVLASDAAVRRLNRDFAGQDHATDVLSFPSEPGAPRGAGRRIRLPKQPPAWLGDVVIAMGVARRQAASAGHALRAELQMLALHGLLHLLGHDHERDGGRMARLERRLRRRGGLAAGLTERASRPGPAARRRR